jgi:hypothetical protein
MTLGVAARAQRLRRRSGTEPAAQSRPDATGRQIGLSDEE